MGALRAAQFEYENRMPPAVGDDTDAERVWVDNAIEELLAGADVKFQRRMRQPQGVTFDQFAVAVDEFVMGQLGASGISNSVLGRLVLAGRRRDTAESLRTADEILHAADPDEALRDVARKLLSPLAVDGLIAQSEEL